MVLYFGRLVFIFPSRRVSPCLRLLLRGPYLAGQSCQLGHFNICHFLFLLPHHHKVQISTFFCTMLCVSQISNPVFLLQGLYTLVPQTEWFEDEGLGRWEVTSRADSGQSDLTTHSTINPIRSCLGLSTRFGNTWDQTELRWFYPWSSP